MEQDVQFVFSVYGAVLWFLIAILGTLWWWAWRPMKRNAPRTTVARVALLLSLFGVPFLAEGVDLDAQLILLLAIFASAIALWRVKANWPIYLFLACGFFAFLRDGMSLEVFLVDFDTLGLFNLLSFRVETTAQAVIDVFIMPVLHGSSLVLVFRILAFPLGAWAAANCLQTTRERDE